MDSEAEPEAFYRVPLSSGEALATLAALRALHGLLSSDEVISDIDPGILESAADRIAAEVPEFAADRAARIAASLAETLVASLASEERIRGTLETRERESRRPPFPIGRNRRLLEDALEQGRSVEIEYYVASRNEWTVRGVDIQDVYENDDTWYLSGHCQMRDEFRHFRLDHIGTVRLLDDEESDGVPDPFEEEPGKKKGSGEQSGAFDGRGDRIVRRRRRGGDSRAV